MYAQKLSLRDTLAKNYINALGWRTKRRLVLIESDDWGSIRMPSLEVYNKLVSEGVGEGCFFDKYDSLESSKDLELLFEVLSSVKDKNGRNAVMQPFAVVANPNYEAISAKGFTEYVYEPFTDTYKRYPHTQKSFDVIKEGMSSGVWYPQSHGREHIQINRWIRFLNSDSPFAKLSFNLKAFHSGVTPKNFNFNRAFDYDSKDELPQLKEIIRDGLSVFEQIYGYQSLSLCYPCGYTSSELRAFSSQEGIKLKGGQFHSPNGDGTYSVFNDFWGSKDDNGMVVYRRNCKFEPSRDHSIDWVDRCLNEIKIAFRWGKPAVIDSHRVNFIGGIYPENRDYTLREFGRLLKEIVKRWPEVEFVTSEDLYHEMTRTK